MNPDTHWQGIAERLAEFGWSWQGAELTDRVGCNTHDAEAHNEEGEIHAVVTPDVGSAFVALERSVKAARK